jgi:hypothetical protein
LASFHASFATVEETERFRQRFDQTVRRPELTAG